MRVAPTLSKSGIRRRMRARRAALSPGQQQRASRALCSRLASHPYFIAARRVGLYHPNDGEIDVTPLAAHAPSKRFFLPVLPPKGKLRLWFGPYNPGDTLVPDRFGIPAPVTAGRVRAEALDLLLIPLVAFDDYGGRIGMGGGYYDASLEFLIRFPRLRPTRVVGAAHDFQRVERIPMDRWDVPLHGIATDSRFVRAAGAP